MNSIENLRKQTNIYDPLVQRQLIEAIESGENSISEIIAVVTDIHTEARTKQYGMWQRLNMKKASRFEWDDSRLADGVPIFAKNQLSSDKVNHKSHTPFDRSIMNNKSSFFMGKPLEIVSEDNQEKIDYLYDRLGMRTTQIELAQSAIDQGTGYLLIYSPKGDNRAYVARKQSFHCVVLYDQDTMQAKYGLIYSPILSYGTNDQRAITSSEYTGVWYDSEDAYEFNGSLESLKVSSPEPHLFDGVPLIEFPNNTERISDVELTIGLQDLFDVMDSDLLSELSQLRLAYMLLKNMGLNFDQEMLDKLREAGVFVSDDEKADIKFISKDVQYQAVEYAKRDLKARIYEQSNSYDPNTIASESGNVTAFQIRMKLKPLEDSTKETELAFRRSFIEMLRLISEYNKKYNKQESFEWTECDLIFSRNYPVNIMEDIKQAQEAGFEFSQDTLSELIPIEFDQKLNSERLQGERQGVFEYGDNENIKSIDSDISSVNTEVDKDIVLNGAQIKSALDIVRAVKTGEITTAEGLNMIELFFNIKPENARKILEGASV
jgi:SPP1 family phage portal protein